MTRVTIFGDGNMGTAIGQVLSRGGAEVTFITTSTPHRAVDSELVILAVPFAALEEIVAVYGDEFAEKVVVDLTNPIDFSTFSLIPPADSSAASLLAEKLPRSTVLKAFNTNFAPTISSGRTGSVGTTVLVAGDDPEAKSTLITTVKAGGLRALDAGTLARARELESVAYLQITLAASEKVTFAGGIAIVE